MKLVKPDLLKRVANILVRLRALRSQGGFQLGVEIGIIEGELDELETKLSDIIDDYMAKRLEKLLCEKRRQQNAKPMPPPTGGLADPILVARAAERLQSYR